LSQIKVIRPDGMDELRELALNLHWSWNHASDSIWEALDAELWQSTQNPWVILRTASKEKIQSLLADAAFRRRLQDVLQKNNESYQAPAWFQQKHADSPLSLVAYFSMEFMLSEALPIYSGGLGNVAGDQMKAASDLGVPVVGVGLLYGQGYFRQLFDMDGKQEALYPVNDPGQMPVRPLRQVNGEWLRLPIQVPGATIWIRCWEVHVGRTKLYLLDANDFANSASQRCITSQLYGGDAEMRLRQELILGIGGWRLLRALGLKPDVCHLNEGHAGFAILERARCYMEDYKTSFAQALTVTRAGNLFTTHTAVAAGFDRFDAGLMHKYLRWYAEERLGISIEDLLALGRQSPDNTSEPFNMAYLAVRGSGQINGVSKLHGKVSRMLFETLFPRWPEAEVPITSVTNGVHMPTWDGPEADDLWTAVCGKERWCADGPTGDDIRTLTDDQIWRMRNAQRAQLIERVRARYAKQLASEYLASQDVSGFLKEEVLTIGFARRFATYKRTNLLLHDADRLIRLLSNPERPVQLILAGKAHPADQPGQAMIKQWNDFLLRPEVRGRIIFLSDYDMQMAQELVQGMDVWINTPRRPWEASGTSGMKVLVNGGLNLSELDGWWAEAYSPQVGWAIGDGREHGDDPGWDAAEAEAVYRLLEQEVVPAFYERNEKGMPTRWLERIRESMAQLTPEFSVARTLRQYTEDHYLPAASHYAERAANQSELGADVLRWQQDLARGWSSVHFGKVEVETRDQLHYFRVEIFPGNVSVSELQVQLYANPLQEGDAAYVTMPVVNAGDGRSVATFAAQLAANRPAGDYTVRVVPYRRGTSVPLEAGHILWQH
jgi:glycogen phosphorylase